MKKFKTVNFNDLEKSFFSELLNNYLNANNVIKVSTNTSTKEQEYNQVNSISNNDKNIFTTSRIYLKKKIPLPKSGYNSKKQIIKRIDIKNKMMEQIDNTYTGKPKMLKNDLSYQEKKNASVVNHENISIGKVDKIENINNINILLNNVNLELKSKKITNKIKTMKKSNNNGIKFYNKLYIESNLSNKFNTIGLKSKKENLISNKYNSINVSPFHTKKTSFKLEPKVIKLNIGNHLKIKEHKYKSINKNKLFLHNNPYHFSTNSRNALDKKMVNERIIRKNLKIKIDSNKYVCDPLDFFSYTGQDKNLYKENTEITQNEAETNPKGNFLSPKQWNLLLNEIKKSKLKHNKHLSSKVTEMDKNNIYYNRSLNTIEVNSYKYKNFHPLIKLKFENILFSSINTNFKIILIKFLDKKTLIEISSLNKTFYKSFRKKIYKLFYDKIIKSNNNSNYIVKILCSLTKYASTELQIKDEKKIKAIYDYYKNSTSNYNDLIKQDIIRTFPHEPYFNRNSNNIDKLFNLLNGYSNFNTNIGYAQGLNFLAASALFMFKNEEKTFIFLDGLINRFQLNQLISVNNQYLVDKVKYFSYILNKYCKDFINYLSTKFLSHDFFSDNWLITLFSSSMEKNKLYICWCFMTVFGWKFFYSFSVQLLLFYHNTLIQINERLLSTKMKELLKENQFIKDFDQIIKNTLSFMEEHIIL